MSIIDAYIGNNPVDEVYLGSQLIYGRYHPHTHSVLDEAQRQGFKKPLNTNAFDAFVRDLVSSGIWDLLDVLYLFASDLGSDFNFRRINLINPNKHLATPYGGLIWTSEGVKGNGSNGYVDTSFNPNQDGINYKLNNASRMAVQFSEPSSTSVALNVIDGTADSSTQNTMFNLIIAAQKINNGAADLVKTVNLRGNGFKALLRENDTVTAVNKEKTEQVFSVASSVIDVNQVIFRRGNGFSQLGNTLYAMGASISFAQSQEFRRITNKYLKSINLNEIA